MTLFSLITLALRSLMSRRGAVLLSTFAVALSVTLFLGVEKLRKGASAGFESTISGTDLIVGARSGPVNLLLYSVFRIGDPTNNISWDSYQELASRPQVAWTIPLSLGDSHANYRVIGTTKAYLDHYQYGNKRQLSLDEGKWFDTPEGAVLGADVAAELGYTLGTSFPISHGLVATEFSVHEGFEFVVTGILARTGTPVDRGIHVSLAGLDAVHGVGGHDHDHGDVHSHGHTHDHDHNHAHGVDPATITDIDAYEPVAISAFMVGLKQRPMVLLYQRQVNTYRGEPLSGIMPGIALTQLWTVVGTAEMALSTTAAFVVVTGLLTLLIAILSSLNARNRELAILRAAGAGPSHIFSLVLLETLVVAIIGTLIGAVIVYGGLGLLAPIISQQYGVPLADLGVTLYDITILSGVIGLATLLGLVPATQAYRRSLAAGLTMRL